MKVTQRMLADSALQLRITAKDLLDAANGEPLVGTKGSIVPASVVGLRAYSEFLERVSEELLALVDDEEPVEVPRGDLDRAS